MSRPISEEDTGSVDTYDLLNHPLRRRVLLELPNHDNPVRLPVLAEGIHSLEMPGEKETTRHDATANTDTIRTYLHHVHLPKFEAVGWIEYDSESRTIRYGSQIGSIQSALRTTLAELEQISTAYDERTAELDSQ